MVAAFLELHHEVDEACDAALHSFTEGLIILSQDPPDVGKGRGGDRGKREVRRGEGTWKKGRMRDKIRVERMGKV